MNINPTTLRSLYTGFSSAFTSGFSGVQSMYQQVATVVPSTTRENEYGWLKNIPGFREWIGDRVIQSISSDGYKIRNKPYEQTVGVNRDDIEDDNLGIYGPLFESLGQSAAEFPDTLVWAFLASGFATNCFDGQYFFDTDHPVIAENGNTMSVSNSGGGSGTGWYLLDTSRPLKPLIYQNRKPFNNLIRKDDEKDDNVFNRKEFIYGSDGRCNVGFGFWQMAYGSKQELTGENFGAARAAMGSFKGDYGRPLGIKPRLLVVPPALEGKANKIVKNELAAGGESNEWVGTAQVLVVPWLA